MKTKPTPVARLVVMLGAATTSVLLAGPLPETQIDLSQTGRMAVVAFSSAAQVNLVMPDNRTEAASEAADAIRLMRQDEFNSLARAMAPIPGGGAITLATPFLFPAVSALGGGINAARSWLRAEPEHQLAPSREALQAAVAGVQLENLVRDQILAALEGKTRGPLTVIDRATLQKIDPFLPERAWRNDATLSTKARRALADRGLQNLLEIRVHAPSLVARGPLERELVLSAQVRVRVLTLPAGMELYRRDSDFFSEARPHTEWAANGGSLVRDEIVRCVATTSETGIAGLTGHRPGYVARNRQMAAVTR